MALFNLDWLKRGLVARLNIAKRVEEFGKSKSLLLIERIKVDTDFTRKGADFQWVISLTNVKNVCFGVF